MAVLKERRGDWRAVRAETDAPQEESQEYLCTFSKARRMSSLPCRFSAQTTTLTPEPFGTGWWRFVYGFAGPSRDDVHPEGQGVGVERQFALISEYILCRT